MNLGLGVERIVMILHNSRDVSSILPPVPDQLGALTAGDGSDDHC